jgi:gluconate:H+ symporter, GntP family
MDALWIFLAGMIVVVGGILALRLHAFLALLLGAYLVAVLTPASALEEHGRAKGVNLASQSTIERITREFGGTAGRIGILIALATIVGKCLLESGGAERIVRTLLRIFGEKNAAAALLTSGFLLGIPVFFDTVFFLMIPLAKALALRTGRNYVLYVMAIIAGGSMTHSLVPPTPGPLFIASELGVNIGLMIAGGIVIGIGTAASGWVFARWANRRMNIPIRETAPGSLAHLQALADRPEKELPSFLLSITPILLPVVLITSSALLKPGKGSLLAALGDPNLALGVSAMIGLATLLAQGKRRTDVFSGNVARAIEEAGSIILITCAGGAFGGMLQQSGIGPRLQELSMAWPIGMIPLAWAFTAVVRIAQGSATVAMITCVGAIGGAATPEALGYHPLWVALAIGCGSKPIPWMNDSGFWVITKMSGFTEKECFATFSPMVTIMGTVGLFLVMILAKLFPLI